MISSSRGAARQTSAIAPSYELGEIPQTSSPGGRQGVVEAEFAPCRLILRARFGRV